MNALLKIVLSLSLSGTILILALLLLRPLCRNRLSWRWQYYIWLLVIARLLLPLTPETSITGYLFRQAESRIAWSGGLALTYIDGEAVSGKNTEDSLHQNETGTDSDLPHTDSDDRSGTDTPQDTTTSPITKDILSVLCTVWLVMALLLFVRRITIYQSFVKYVNAGSVPVDDIALLEQFGQIIEEQNVHRTIDLCVNNLVSSPLLIGFLHTRIVLPTTALSKEDFYHTILHELIHYKRRDMFYKWLVQLTICLHWFNPFVYLMGYEINRLCELSCDERVISTFNDNSRKSYGDTLLNAIGTGGTYKDAIASVTLHESKELLKGRLDAIMNYKKIPKWLQITAVFLTGILVGGAVVLGAYAAPGDGLSGSSQHPAPSSSQFHSNEDKVSHDDSAAMHTVDTTESDMTNNASLPDYTIQYEDDIYYIMVDGADEDDKPLSTVTNGYKKLVLVRKDAYAVFGTFDDHDMASLAKHIKAQCRTMLENDHITQESADIVIRAAEEIQAAYATQENGFNETSTNETLSGEDFLDEIIEPEKLIDDWTEKAEYEEHEINDYQEEYNEQNIVILKNAYYYQNARVRILMDVKANGSFENFAYHKRGTIDLRLTRDSNNKIVSVEYLTAEESAEILEDIDSYPVTDLDDTRYDTTNIIDLNRLTKQEIPDALRKTLDSCDTGKWYLIDDNGHQYIYYNGLPHTYAYEPRITGSETGDLITVEIIDITADSPFLRTGEPLSNYVLLSFSYSPGIPDKGFSLTLKYNSVPVAYEILQTVTA